MDNRSPAKSDKGAEEPEQIKALAFNRKRTFQSSIEEDKLIMIGGPSALDNNSLTRQNKGRI